MAFPFTGPRYAEGVLHRARLDQATKVLTQAGLKPDKAQAFVTAMALAAAPEVRAASLPYGAVPNRAAVEAEEERDKAEAKSDRAYHLGLAAFYGGAGMLFAIMLTAGLTKYGVTNALREAGVVPSAVIAADAPASDLQDTAAVQAEQAEASGTTSLVATAP